MQLGITTVVMDFVVGWSELDGRRRRRASSGLMKDFGSDKAEALDTSRESTWRLSMTQATLMSHLHPGDSKLCSTNFYQGPLAAGAVLTADRSIPCPPVAL